MNYKNYQETINEGGEGYNPYAQADMDQARAKTIAHEKWIDDNYFELKDKWMAAVKKYAKGDAVSVATLAKIEKEVGVTLSEIQFARKKNEP